MAIMNPLERGEGRADLVGRGNREPGWLVGGKGHVVTFHSAGAARLDRTGFRQLGLAILVSS